MAQNYTRQSSFSDGDTITSSLFNNEYNQIVNAFTYSSSSDSSTGHKHDGNAGQGGNIPQIGDIDFNNKIVVDGTNNRWGVFVEVSGSAVEQIRIQDGGIVPVTDSDVDLGTSSLYFKAAYIDAITTTGNVAVGGNLTVTGTTTFNGGTITMGDAATDNVVFGANVDSHIIPDDDGTYDLGSSTQEWKDIYIDGTAYVDAINFNGTAITATAAELNILDGKAFLDEDDMSSNSATGIASQQSIKAYVDAQQDTVDTFAEVLALSNTTGGTDISVSTGDDITFADSSKAIFGAGSDLQIYHNGSKSIIHDVTAGNLEILADDFAIKNSTGVNTLFFADAPSGAVSLYHSNAAKLATTSTGIDVTGSVTTDGIINSQTSEFFSSQAALVTTGSTAKVYATNTTFDGTNGSLVLQSRPTAGADVYIAAGATPKVVAKFIDGGDVHFFEDTGTTAKLTWDASAELLTTTGLTVDGDATIGGASGGKLGISGQGINAFATTTDPSVYRTGSGGSGLFTAAGNLVIQPRTSAARSVSIATSSDGSTTLERFRIASNGDVSLYEDTGTTAKLTWDASAELLTTTGLTVSNADGSIVKLESTGTGLGAGAVLGDLQFYGNDASTPGAGIKASITATTVAALGDDSQLMFSTSNGTTNNINRMLIANNGDVSLYEDTGTTAKLHLGRLCGVVGYWY